MIPILLYGLLQLPAAVVAGIGRRAQWPVAAGAAAVLAVAAWSSGRDVADAARTADRADGRAVDGPQDPSAVEMFAAVEAIAAPDDVVGFFKARAMTLETDRRAVQIGANRSPLAEPITYDVLVLRTTDPVTADVRADPTQFDLLWSNQAYLILRPTPSKPPN